MAVQKDQLRARMIVLEAWCSFQDAAISQMLCLAPGSSDYFLE